MKKTVLLLLLLLLGASQAIAGPFPASGFRSQGDYVCMVDALGNTIAISSGGGSIPAGTWINVSTGASIGFNQTGQTFKFTAYDSAGNTLTPANPMPVSDTAGNALLTTLSGKDFATQTTLAAMNTKIPASPATEGGNLATIAGKDFATQTTLAAMNTKIPASPATEGGNLATIAGKDFATQTTLAAMNTKIPASPATEGGNLLSVATNTSNLPTAKGSQNVSNSIPVYPAAVTATGVLSIAGQSLTMTVKGLATVGFRLSGTWSDAGGAADKAFVTNDPTGVAGWTPLDIYDYTGIKQANGVNSSNGTSAWRVNVAGGQFVSISATSLTSGSFTVDMQGVPGSMQLPGLPDIISFNSGSQSNGNKAITAHAMTEKLIDAGTAPTAVWGGNAVVGMTVTGSTLGTTALTFYSPGASRKFHLLGYQIYISGLAAAASSPVTFSLQDSGTNIPGTQIAVDMFTSAPTLSGIAQGYRTGWIELPDFGYTASANANVLQLKSDKALTAGTVTVQALVTFQ